MAVARHLRYDAHIFPGAVDAVAHGVCDFLWPSGGVGQIVLVAAAVYPRRLGEVGQLHTMYRAVQLNHIGLEAGVVAVFVAPEEICLTVVVDKHGWVDAYPRVRGSGAVGLCEQRAADGVAERSARRVGDGHADARAVGADIIVVLAVALDTLGGIGRMGAVPRLKLLYPKRYGMLRPMLHVGGREYTPVGHMVSGLVARLVGAGI